MLNNHPYGTVHKRDLSSKGGKRRFDRLEAGDFPVTVTRVAPKPRNLSTDALKRRQYVDIRPAWGV